MSGGTGYLGRALAATLLARGHRVRLLARPGSEHKAPAGAEVISGDPLRAGTFAGAVSSGDTFVQLTGAPHPAPWKGAAFRAVDQVSCRASITVAREAGVRHFVYVSVAHPAPVMRAYIEVRQDCERRIAEAGLLATVLRPWYILGPGHRWPVLVKPVYALLRALPATRDTALRLGLVTREQMVAAMTWAIEHPPEAARIVEVPAIRSGRFG